MKRFFYCLLFVLCSGPVFSEAAVDYDIVYVRSPRAGDNEIVPIPEVAHPIQILPGTDLMLLHPDGSEEVLVPGGNGAVVDPYVSFDGLWVYYAKFHDQRPEMLDTQRRGNPSRAGSDIFKINIQTREIVQLTTQEWTPNTGLLDWSRDHLKADENGEYYLGYGIFNLGPCPLPEGKVIFTSSRNSYLPNKRFTSPNLQLFVMDNDGGNVELTGHLNLGSALHPTILTDGRVMFSSYEGQGIRDARAWGLWSTWPDGRNWGPLMSAFALPKAFHFQTQLSNGDIAVVEYYNLNNNGFGTLLAFPANPPVDRPAFGSPFPNDPSNPPIQRGLWWFEDQPDHVNHGKPRYNRYKFSPAGLYTLTGFAHSDDTASSRNTEGDWAGKVTHPCGAPANDVLLVWSSGPANSKNRPSPFPAYDAGVYLLKKGIPTTDEKDLILIKDDPAYNEMQPRPVVTYETIYGIKQPESLPWYKNDGSEHEELEEGTPYGLVGTSSFYKRDSFPGVGDHRFDGLEPFNTSQHESFSNWRTQGADAGKYSNSEIHAVRVLSMEPTTHVGRGPGVGNGAVRGYHNHADERLRILGEIPLRKFDENGQPILDPEGNPDTSFLAKIPADVPFTFQTLDKDGLVLNMSQTWHQVRPGEVRHDCGGCHGHSQEPLPFEGTFASSSGYKVSDLIQKTPLLSKDAEGEASIIERAEGAVDVEYYRDIKPILERSCVECHSVNGRQEMGLALDDETITNGYENTYNRLARDLNAEYGIPPVLANGKWNSPNASRYIRKFQSRRSLLIWKVFGRRLDGWSNDDHPTESILGDVSSLPEGVHPNHVDIDYSGSIMPPLDSGVPPLSEDEKILFARWVDLGCPITRRNGPVPAEIGWFADELRPTVDVSLPGRGFQAEPLNKIRLGFFDYYSGLDRSSISVKANFLINDWSPGTELFSFFQESGDHVWSLDIDPPITDLEGGNLSVRVRDNSGNWSETNRSVNIRPAQPPLVIETMNPKMPDGNHLYLRGEQASQSIIEASNDLFNWEQIGELLDFDGSQKFIDESESNQRFYRTAPLGD